MKKYLIAFLSILFINKNINAHKDVIVGPKETIGYVIVTLDGQPIFFEDSNAVINFSVLERVVGLDMRGMPDSSFNELVMNSKALIRHYERRETDLTESHLFNYISRVKVELHYNETATTENGTSICKFYYNGDCHTLEYLVLVIGTVDILEYLPMCFP